MGETSSIAKFIVAWSMLFIAVLTNIEKNGVTIYIHMPVNQISL